MNSIFRYAKGLFPKQILLIWLVAFLCHGLLLICDYTYWDGWWLIWFLKNGKSLELQSVFSQVGVPLAGYYESLYAVFPNPNYAAKVVNFFFFIVAGFCCYNILVRSKFFDDLSAVIITCLFIAYPGFQAIGDLTVIHYVTGHGLFWVAAYLAILARAQNNWLLRILSLSLFYLSFMNNALLVYFAGFLLYFFFLHDFDRAKVLNIKIYLFRILKSFDYIALPVLCWITRKTHGNYSGYNTPNFRDMQIVAKIKNLFGDSFFAYFNETIERLALVDCMILVVVLCCMRGIYSFLKHNDENQRSLNLLLQNSTVLIWSFVLLFFASFAHMAVRPVGYFVAHGVSSRSSNLLGLPFAFMMFASVRLLCNQLLAFSKNFSVFIFALILGVFIFENNRCYLEWQASAIKDMALFQKLKTDKNFIEASVVIIDDKFDFYYLGEIMDTYSIRIFHLAAVDNDLKRIGIDINIDKSFPRRSYRDKRKKIPIADIETLLDATSSGISLKMDTIDARGGQVDLKITKTYAKSLYHMSLAYWRNYYFNPSNLNTFLSGILRIETKQRDN